MDIFQPAQIWYYLTIQTSRVTTGGHILTSLNLSTIVPSGRRDPWTHLSKPKSEYYPPDVAIRGHISASRVLCTTIQPRIRRGVASKTAVF
jgi:hypothetical protein